jgi:carbon monoxide dehydrogenase subunit G
MPTATDTLPPTSHVTNTTRAIATIPAKQEEASCGRAPTPTICRVRYRREVEVATPAEPTFAYLSDFANTAEWDPGIVEARRLTPAPTAVGSRFEVVALFRGRRQRFEYVVTELVEGTRVALRGEGEKALSDDVISVAPHEGGTRVAYEADLRLKGVYRVAEPFLRSTFERMGDAALDGLVARLARSG